MARTLLYAALCSISPLLVGCSRTVGVSPNPGSTNPPTQATAPPPIQHVVIIMQENRTFDNLFNGFPGADTAQSGMDGTTPVPMQSIALNDGRDISHSHTAWWKNWDNGKMDGFANHDTSSPLLPFSYVQRSDTTPYWNLAAAYTIGDRMFQSNTGPSFVAHQYLIAGQSGQVSENPVGANGIWGCDASTDTRAALIGPNGTDLPGVYPCFDYSTMADLLDARGISWAYYAPPSTDSFFVLSAYQAIRHIRFGSDWTSNVISPQTQVLTDIAQGKLAAVTWIIPDFTHSDHPGSASNEGPDWVGSITNAIGSSPFWNTTAIFITWDDWGGWYDHVNPPQVDNMGLGFRIPLLVVSPYARHGYVSHVTHEPSGFLTYIEKIFGLPNLGSRDVLADDYSDCFDYTQTPAPYVKVQTRHTADYLIHLKPSGAPDDD
jgi:phospholipase C